MGRIKVTYEYENKSYSSGAYYNSLSEAVKNVHKHLLNADFVSWTYVSDEGTIYGSLLDKNGWCNWIIQEVSEEDFAKEINQY